MANDNKITKLAIVGAGWRAEFILGVAMALPERFEVAGIVVRKSVVAARMSEKWKVPAFSTVEELVADRRPDFIVLSVPREAAPELIQKAIGMDIPVLSETPPAGTESELNALYRLAGKDAPIQVAEQYHLQPFIASQISIGRSGIIGDVSECRASISHGYHGVSIMRRMLGVGFDDAKISALQFSTPIVGGPGREGDPKQEETLISELTIAHLDFGDRHGIYDWAPAQNRSWIRKPRLLARGDRGEIDGNIVRYLADFATPNEIEIRRVDTGHYTNLEGYFLKGFTLGYQWIYRNRFAPARLMDDEIAVADCLDKMAEYVAGGPSFYGLAEASQDHYLALLIDEATQTGKTVHSKPQSWVL